MLLLLLLFFGLLILDCLLRHENRLLVILKDVVEAPHFIQVFGNMSTSYEANRLSLLLFEFQHCLCSFLVVIYEDLEIHQVICLDDTVLKLNQDLLLILAEFREFCQVLW